MKKFKLTSIVIAICGLFLVNQVGAQDGGDGGGFDGGGFDGGGFDGGSFDGGGFDGGGFDGGGYYDDAGGFDGSYYDGGGFDAADHYDQGSDLGGDYNPSDFNSNDTSFSGDVLDQQNDIDFADDMNQTGEISQPNDSGFTDNNPDPSAESPLHEKVTQDPTGDSLTASDNQPPEATSAQDSEITQTDTSAQNTDNQDNQAADTTDSAGAVQPTQTDGVAQSGASAQDINIQNNVQTDQNVVNNDASGHHHNDGGHHHGHHHHLDGFGLGLGLGLGLGWGFGPGWGWGFSPYNSFGFYSNWGGVGFYNNYAFGPYRRFGGYYPLGGYPAGVITSPVLASPMVLAPQTPTYIQQNPAPRPPVAVQKSNYWYYCRNPEGYYPKVRECSVEWIKVPPQTS